MKVEAASIQMQASYRAATFSFERERLETWSGNNRSDNGRRAEGAPRAVPAPSAESARVALSEDARKAQRAEGSEDDDNGDAKLRLIRNMVEFLTGKRIKLFDAEEFSRKLGEGSEGNKGHHGVSDPGRSPQSGPGFRYEYESMRAESQSLSFSASGTIRTADGKEISFELGFEMSHSFVEYESQTIQGGTPLKDPLMLDFGGPASALSDTQFAFDLDGDGNDDALPTPLSGKGYLVFDRNNNQRIDDGSELFGPRTGNGFSELAALDQDGNGFIDEGDASFSQLGVWQPGQGDDGRSFQTLAAAGIGAVGTQSTSTPFALKDAQNQLVGMMRASGIYLNENGTVGTVSQVDLKV